MVEKKGQGKLVEWASRTKTVKIAPKDEGRMNIVDVNL